MIPSFHHKLHHATPPGTSGFGGSRITLWPNGHPAPALRSSAYPTPQQTVDVAVIGSGIIGLCVVRKLLTDTQLSVALLDRNQPCSGATGAGQGYIWLAHRDPASVSWGLARRSKAIWEQLAAHAGSDSIDGHLADALEWQANGSLLLATTAAEVQQLQARAELLQQQGLRGVVLLSPRELKMHEPALQLPTGSMGLLVGSDAQINGKRTAFAVLEYCKQLASVHGQQQSAGGSKRLYVGLDEAVLALEPSGGEQAVDVVTAKQRVRARRGVVVAAGVWSGQLLAEATGETACRQLLQPRRGHLLEMQPPSSMPRITAGMMELSYTQHYSSAEQFETAQIVVPEAPKKSSSQSHQEAVDITFTATTSAAGNLLIGSSREFSGWEATPSRHIISAILTRASQFLPQLSSTTADDLLSTTRVGLRPYAVGGLPAIGLVPGLPGVAVAAGHEGSGLCLGPATAELVLHHLLGLQPTDGDMEVSFNSLSDSVAELLPERRLRCMAE